MLPLLQYLTDGKEHRIRDVVEGLTEHFELTQEERAELSPSGQSYVFYNRVAWAKTYTRMAGLIDNPRRGIIVITDAGKELLASNPARVDMKLLQKYESYRKWKSKPSPKRSKKSPKEYNEQEESKTPEEQIETAFETIRHNLAKEILAQLKACSPSFFEKVVIDVLVDMGYGGSRKDAGEAVGRSGDEGIDGIIKEDRLGLDIIYIQAKKWEGTVSRAEVQKFAGALQGKRARKGVLITTSEFSSGARQYASSIENKMILIDGEQLAHLMIDFNVGVAVEANYQLKRIDSDFFEET